MIVLVGSRVGLLELLLMVSVGLNVGSLVICFVGLNDGTVTKLVGILLGLIDTFEEV